jgi:hypothetical protein
MRNTLVRYDYNFMGRETPPTEEALKKSCFKVSVFKTQGEALMVYANTPAEWSTILDDKADVNAFINEAWNHIKEHDTDWLEENFV